MARQDPKRGGRGHTIELALNVAAQSGDRTASGRFGALQVRVGRDPAWFRWTRVFVVTAVEASAVYCWLRFDDPLLALAALALGQVIETVLLRLGVASGVRNRWGRLEDPVADGEHFRRIQRKVDVAGIAEIGIWLLWLFIAGRAGQPVAAGVLFVLMHVKHHIEAAAVGDTRIRAGVFERRNALASAMETAGAVWCLALIHDDHLVRAAVVLFVGFLFEHIIQIDALRWEIRSRDIRLPRDPRWEPADRWWELKRYIFTHFPVLWRLVQRKPLERRINRYLIDKAIARVPPRPNPLSTMKPYTSWASLTDRHYSGRHLPPVPEGAATPATARVGPPSAAAVAELFQRGSTMRECPKSTVLFAFFAQWFTDGFLRTKRNLPRPELRRGLRDLSINESTHEIDLSQFYGLTEAATHALRTHKDGLLRSQCIKGEEYPPYYCLDGKPKPEFGALSEPVGFDALPTGTKNQLFASGTDVTNLGVATFNTLFLREHNGIARRLRRENPSWDDDRVFETARNVLIVVLIRIVVEEYINHITPQVFQFRLAPKSFTNAPWHRQNWMAIEFNLLYRWHSLVPSTFHLDGKALKLEQLLADTDPLTSIGLGSFMTAASSQPAGRIGLSNTDRQLVEWADVPSIEQARAARLASFNDYRRLCRLLPVAEFADISADERTARELEELYGNVENVEFYVGLFAEDIRPNSVLPPLMTMMVAFDAFSQALTNPLLAPRVCNEQTFSSSGMEIIRQTRTVSDLVRRNVRCGPDEYWVSFKRRDAPPTLGRVPARLGPGSARRRL
jgi:prostaglandin-endoperoxide synthase 2